MDVRVCEGVWVCVGFFMQLCSQIELQLLVRERMRLQVWVLVSVWV